MQTLASVSSCPESAAVGSSMISVFITNLGKYNEGELVGEWLSLPTTTEEFKASLKRIGIDGLHYEEYFLTDYESIIEGVTPFINEYSNLNELNYLAFRLEELSNNDIEIYEAVIDMGGYIQSVKELINLVDNLDCFQCLWNVNDEYDLGYYWIEECGCYNLKELGSLANYFDYEKYGRDIALEHGGTFSSCGYIYHSGESFVEDYDGKHLSEEYCIFD